MKISLVKKLTPIERFLYWINERESIRLKKENKQHLPYTDDQILQSFRFCCVRRMDDKVSRWLLNQWYLPNKDHRNIVLAATLARQFNNTESLEEIGFPFKWEPKKYEKILNARKARGLTTFSAAYMITGTLGGTKIEQIIWKVADPIHKAKFEVNPTSMKDNWLRLIPFAGFSSFMAGQVVADLRHAVTGSWKDRMTWAPMGPGSMRGLNILLGLDPHSKKYKTEEFCEELCKIFDVVKKHLPSIAKRLELHDIQNCCCEIFKYTKALTGVGRPKQKYPGIY